MNTREGRPGVNGSGVGALYVIDLFVRSVTQCVIEVMLFALIFSLIRIRVTSRHVEIVPDEEGGDGGGIRGIVQLELRQIVKTGGGVIREPTF